MIYIIVFVLVVLCCTTGAFARKHVVAHRGASGYMPEHSIASYRLAIDLQADYVEPDLSLSKDGVLMCIHDPILDTTTNVDSFPEFAERKRTHEIDGRNVTGFFVNDFTLAELQTLALKQRYPNTRSTAHDRFLRIPTFSEVIAMVQTEYQRTGRFVGIYVELKHPTFFNTRLANPFAFEDNFIQELIAHGLEVNGPDVPNDLSSPLPVPIAVQSFEVDTLKYLKRTTNLPLVQLLESEEDDPTVDNRDPQILEHIASYAHGIGPDKSFLGSVSYAVAKELMSLIKSLSLVVHPYTFRADMKMTEKFNKTASTDTTSQYAQEEMYFYCCLGVDGIFSEFPDRSRATLQAIEILALTSPHQPCGMACDLM